MVEPVVSSTDPGGRERDDPLATALASACVGAVRRGAPLAPLTSLRVGGPARVLVTAEVDDDLRAVGRVSVQHDVPWLVVGRGSNLLVADSGWDGVVVRLGRGYRGIEVGDDRVTAGADEPLPALATRLAARGRTGLAWTVAVPGSVGGAVRMNAGAHGSELADRLESADVVRLRGGRRETWSVEQLAPSYRHTSLPDDAVVVAATLRAPPGSPDAERARIEAVRAWRRQHQPVNEPSCGSVFVNPEGASAGELVDLAGGKALRVGLARVSEQHANFIVTEPGATAADVHALILMVRDLVEQRHGVRLRTEVVLAGRF